LHRAEAHKERISVQLVSGISPEIDAVARTASPDRGFLRGSWYAGAAGDDASTLIATRGDGSPVVAVPTMSLSMPLLGARTVPGSYWPFRSIPVDACATEDELATVFADPVTCGALAPVWRMGPLYRNDPVTRAIKNALARAGWTVLIRPMGHSFVMDLSGQGWPRKSTRRRLSNYERQLAQHGPVTFHTITGTEWDDASLDTLSGIEANSWIADTDQTGAKFLTPEQRGLWQSVLADPQIADALSATILHVGTTPVAFSFDLRAGDLQYTIASSYHRDFAAYRPGKIVTYRQLAWAAANGVKTVDLGAGDSGYKREMGAVAGSEIIDLLIVRNRQIARLLSLKWGGESALCRDIYLSSADQRGDQGNLIRHLLTAGAIAAAALALVE
jgi:hypothetical protein